MRIEPDTVDTAPAADLALPAGAEPSADPGSGAEDAARAMRRIDSPLGPLWLGACERGITLLRFEAVAGHEAPSFVAADLPQTEPTRREIALLDALESQLDDYFAGARAEISVPLAPIGTQFQQRVWSGLLKIPCGETRSYASVARAIGHPAAVRAVANANGANRIAILIPCHRVIGSDGSLTGYGGGLDRKDWLLRHEQELAGLFGVNSRGSGPDGAGAA